MSENHLTNAQQIKPRSIKDTSKNDGEKKNEKRGKPEPRWDQKITHNGLRPGGQQCTTTMHVK